MPAEAIVRALRHVWRTLEPLGIPMAVMGGLALAAWKHVRATKDVDLLLGITEGDDARALRALDAAGVRPKRSPPLVRLGQLDLIQLLYEPPEAFMDVEIDLLLGKSPYFHQALNRAIPTRLPDLDIDIALLMCEDLVLRKLLAGRVIDRFDAVALLRANRPSLDIGYMRQWAGKLGVDAELSEVWSQAFPGEVI
jgi:hypothetical protein